MYSRYASLLLLIALPCASDAQQSTTPNYDTVLVCAPSLLDAAKPWIEYRSRQGHQIALVPGDATKDEIRKSIRNIATTSTLKFIVIMGDAPNAAKLGTHVETHQATSKVIAKWGAEPHFATDNFYADLDNDGSPEFAVGRLCADSPEQLAQILQKTISYEQDQDRGPWRRRVNFVAGVGGFGALADKVIETTAKKFITDGIPSAYNTSMTQASWRSPYSPDPRLFQKQTIETMNQGCLAWVYLGHGQERGLDFYRYPGGGLPIFESKNIPEINVRAGSPIAVFLSCYTGAFASPEDCLAEQLLAKQGGPVAVISGSSVTMPYAMTVMGNAMLHELFIERRTTIGEVLFHAKQELAKPTEANPKGMIDQLAMVMSPNPELLDEERTEHVRLFHLFGDPLLRLRHPKPITLEVNDEAIAGETINIRGTSEIAGPCVIELVCRRDRLTFRPPRRGSFEPKDAWLRELQDTYAKANNTNWASIQMDLNQGEFTASLKVPEHATGLSHVRVFAQGDNEFALGATDIYLRAPAVQK